MKPVIDVTKVSLENQIIKFIKSLEYEIKPLIDKGRKLRVKTDQFQFIFAKGVDVTTYVQYGIADLGIVGGDILAEFEPDVYDLFPLPFGQCRMAVAKEKGKEWPDGKKTIASKFTNTTKKFYKEKGESVDIIKLEEIGRASC